MISSIIIAVCFIVMALSLIFIAIVIKRVVATVHRVEERIDPLISQVNAISKQGREMSVHFNEVTANLSTATRYLAESTELIKDEVSELRVLVGQTALVAKDKVDMVSKSIDKTHNQVMNTTEFINTKVVVPAREIAAVMAGVKKGLEVLFAPSPKQIDRVYADDEMFIG